MVNEFFQSRSKMTPRNVKSLLICTIEEFFTYLFGLKNDSKTLSHSSYRVSLFSIYLENYLRYQNMFYTIVGKNAYIELH